MEYLTCCSMEYFVCCSVCGCFHSVSHCRDRQIRETWNSIFYRLNLCSPHAIDYIDDVRCFLEMEVPHHIIPALGIQYAGSNISDSREDHITYILERIRIEIETVNTLSLPMRDEYLRREYPDIYGSSPLITPFRVENEESNQSISFISPQEMEILNDKWGITENNVIVQPHPSLFDNQTENKYNNQNTECPICLETIEFSLINHTNCQHKFCHSCLLRNMTVNMNCPLCRTDITNIYVKTEKQSDDMIQACNSNRRRVDSNYDDVPDLIDSDDVPHLIDYDDVSVFIDSDDEISLVEFLIQENLLPYMNT